MGVLFSSPWLPITASLFSITNNVATSFIKLGKILNNDPFKTIAICLLPDHLHCLWKLPEDDANYSVRWKEIKRLFTKHYLIEIGPGAQRNESRQKRQEAAIWQRRFWEHVIQDDMDFERHLDYIHYNPIKHGYVEKASNWQWSSFHKFVKEGIYDNDWVGGNEGRIQGLNWE